TPITVIKDAGGQSVIPDYDIAPVTVTGTINKADATVKVFNGATDVSNGTAPFTYNALSHGLSATVTGVAAETATLNIDTITYDGSRTAERRVEEVGSQGSQSAELGKINVNENYNSASANASEQINKADATVKVFNGATDVSNGTAPFTYDALPHGLSATVTGVAAETATLNIDTITYDGS